VGTSGQTVKPKVYLAMGISGSFQHLGGIKGAPFIVAVNKNPKAPIFQAADVGIVEDILDFMPELTEKIEEGSSAPSLQTMRPLGNCVPSASFILKKSENIKTLLPDVTFLT
jgi:hypothetical protein